jgi:hypothetical protein
LRSSTAAFLRSLAVHVANQNVSIDWCLSSWCCWKQRIIPQPVRSSTLSDFRTWRTIAKKPVSPVTI